MPLGTERIDEGRSSLIGSAKKRKQRNGTGGASPLIHIIPQMQNLRITINMGVNEVFHILHSPVEIFSVAEKWILCKHRDCGEDWK